MYYKNILHEDKLKLSHQPNFLLEKFEKVRMKKKYSNDFYKNQVIVLKNNFSEKNAGKNIFKIH